MEFRRCGGTGKVDIFHCGRMGEVSHPNVVEGFTELTYNRCGRIPKVPLLGTAEQSRIRLEIRPIADAIEGFKIRLSMEWSGH